MGLVGYAAEKREFINIPDAYEDDRFNPLVDRKSGFRTRSMLVHPIEGADGRVIAVLQVMNKKDMQIFDAGDEELLRAFGDHLAVAVQNCLRESESKTTMDDALRTLTELKSQLSSAKEREGEVLQKSSRKDYVLDVARFLSADTKMDNFFHDAMAKTKEAMQAERCTLFCVDEKTKTVWSKLADGQASEIRLPIGQGIVGTVVQTGIVLNIEDPYNDDRFDASHDRRSGFVTRNILCMPVKGSAGGEVLAAVMVINKIEGGEWDGLREEEGRGCWKEDARADSRTHDSRIQTNAGFDPDDVELLRLLATQLGIGIENKKKLESSVAGMNEANSLIKTLESQVDDHTKAMQGGCFGRGEECAERERG